MTTIIGAVPVRACALAMALLGAGAPASAQNAASREPPLRIAASSFATVEVHLNSRPIGGRWYAEDAGFTGPARVAITYGQPHARGRTVEGGLIPRDTVWRFGANAATALHTDVDLVLGDSARGGLQVPRGDYTLFILYGKAGAQLIVNRQTGQWGTDYDAARDLGRLPLATRRLAEREETLTIHLVPESARPAQGDAELRGQLRIRWGQTEWSAPWSVRR